MSFYKVTVSQGILEYGVNKKYKEKGRSLLFNLKEKNNPKLRESVMPGNISPERLCSTTVEELASKSFLSGDKLKPKRWPRWLF
ncbi:unnamed protein product [Cochlearia groenlandica]